MGIGILYLSFMMILLFYKSRNPYLMVSFLDVGQGDGILLESSSGTVYMIDGGSSSVSDVAKYRISGTLKYQGISQIDYSIITHPDSDHMNGIMQILESMEDVCDSEIEGSMKIQTVVEDNGSSESNSSVPSVFSGNSSENRQAEYLGIIVKQIFTPFVPENDNYQALVELAERKGVPVISLHAGMEIRDGELEILCMHPESRYHSSDSNAYSAVLDVRIGSFSALLVGDLEEEEEKLLLDRKGNLLSFQNLMRNEEGYDLLKVGHHGSRNSSSEPFVRTISPEIAVISAGVNNFYGHPHQETLERLKECDAEIYCTADNGEVIVAVRPDGKIEIVTKLS